LGQFFFVINDRLYALVGRRQAQPLFTHPLFEWVYRIAGECSLGRAYSPEGGQVDCRNDHGERRQPQQRGVKQAAPAGRQAFPPTRLRRTLLLARRSSERQRFGAERRFHFGAYGACLLQELGARQGPLPHAALWQRLDGDLLRQFDDGQQLSYLILCVHWEGRHDRGGGFTRLQAFYSFGKQIIHCHKLTPSPGFSPAAPD
jgi:hypothetical protein